MTARLFAFVIWAALAASVVAWALRLGAGSQPVPAHAVVVADNAAHAGDLTRLLGADAPVAVAAAPAVPGSARLKLLGVVAARAEAAHQAGVAVIAVDGRPARPYRVGGAVDQDLVLLEVRQRSASLGPPAGPASVKLELPALTAAATGTRPTAVNGALPGLQPRPMGRPVPPPPPPMPQEQFVEPAAVEEPQQAPDASAEVETEMPDSPPEGVEMPQGHPPGRPLSN